MLRYAGGKMDWTAFGLPVEGHAAHLPTAADLASAEVATCRLHDRAGRLRPADPLVVTNEHGIVLGVISGEELAGAEPDRTAEELMQPGPSTIRPDVPVEQIAEHYLGERRYLLVTNSDGVLLGVVSRQAVQARVAEAAARGGHRHG